jgi:hypothetical protein
MAASRAEKRARRALLDSLARELGRPGGPGGRLRRTWRLVPYLSVRRAGRGRLRVYCAGTGGQYAFVTADGTVIGLGAGIPAAARDVAAASGRAREGRPAGQVQAGPLGP